MGGWSAGPLQVLAFWFGQAAFGSRFVLVGEPPNLNLEWAAAIRQDHLVVNILKPYFLKMVLKSETCPDAGEV